MAGEIAATTDAGAEPRREPRRHVPPLRPGDAVPARGGRRGRAAAAAVALIADHPDDQVAAYQQLGQSYAETEEVAEAGGDPAGGDRQGPGAGRLARRGRDGAAARLARLRSRAAGSAASARRAVEPDAIPHDGRVVGRGAVRTRSRGIRSPARPGRRSRAAGDLHLPEPDPLRRRGAADRWPPSWPGLDVARPLVVTDAGLARLGAGRRRSSRRSASAGRLHATSRRTRPRRTSWPA